MLTYIDYLRVFFIIYGYKIIILAKTKSQREDFDS